MLVILETGRGRLALLVDRVGEVLSLADICLVPQVFNARRFQLDLNPFPHIVAVDAALSGLAAFADTHPSRQPDTE